MRDEYRYLLFCIVIEPMFSSSSPLDYRQLFISYLDINDIVHSDERYRVADAIIAQQHTAVHSYHPWGWVFHYFDRFVKWDISVEEWMSLGDVDTELTPLADKAEQHLWLHTLTDELVASWSEKDIVVVDSFLWSWYKKKSDSKQWDSRQWLFTL